MTLRRRWAGALDLLALHRSNPGRYPFLLESVARGEGDARLDFLFALPEGTLRVQQGLLHISGDAPADVSPTTNFFDALDAWVATTPSPPAAASLPFAGGWFLFLGYEAAMIVEPGLHLPPSPHALPDALAVRCPAAIIRDHRDDSWTLVAETAAQMAQLVSDCGQTLETPAVPAVAAAQVREADAEPFLSAVRRTLAYLRAGDIFQANLSRRWRGVLAPGVDVADVYARLRQHNPAPFAGLLRWGDAAVVSSSPERLLRIRDGIAETRPIAGTHARSPSPGEDVAQRQRLAGDLKERAEHLMLIDLERNDLGRICEPGTVVVDELMTLESYTHVHHLVSNVRGRLRSGIGPGAALRAVFPGGTITGCPKVRAMEIIAELEGEGRGPYTGAMGYLSRCGHLDTNILIRSLVCESGVVSLRTGAGIVADSEPARELAETRAKALGLLRALGVA